MSVRAIPMTAYTHKVLQSGSSMKCVGFGLLSKFINTISLLVSICLVNAIDIYLYFKNLSTVALIRAAGFWQESFFRVQY